MHPFLGLYPTRAIATGPPEPKLIKCMTPIRTRKKEAELVYCSCEKPKSFIITLSSSNSNSMSRKGSGAAALQKDVPWRHSGVKPVPKIHHSPVLRVARTPHSNYAFAIMKHPNPVGRGLASDAILEAAGPDCIVPGQIKPIRLLGLKVWPIEVDLKFLEPVGKELKLLGKFMDDAVNLMNKSFIDR